MERKEPSFANVKRSLNRLEGFIDDLLLNVQSFSDYDIKDVWTQLSYWVSEVQNNRKGDDSINYIGIYDCVDYILNNTSIVLAKIAFSIETKVKEIESIVLEYISYEITLKIASDFLWETGRILWQIEELYIEPFIQETEKSSTISNPETGESVCINIEDKNISTKAVPLNKAQVMMNIKNEPFQPQKDGKSIPYQECYERLSNGKIRRSAGESETVKAIHEQCDLKTFKYCVDRADMKDIFVKGKKCFINLFLRCISEYYENPSEYRKAAAKALGINSVSSVGDPTKQDFYNLFSGIFKDEDLQRKKK